MNIDQLKTEWKSYSDQLTLSNRINEQLIINILKEKSVSRVTRIRRESLAYLVWMFVVLSFLAAIITGNPFDFVYSWQYIPYAILVLCTLLAIVSIFKTLSDFRADVNAMGLSSFLKKTIETYDKNKKTAKWFGLILFAAGLSTVFSFLPNKIASKGLWPALGETSIGVLITLLFYFIAFRAGAFRNTKREAFANDLQELEQLREMCADLNPVKREQRAS